MNFDLWVLLITVKLQTLLLEHLFQGLLNRYSAHKKNSVVKSEKVVYTELNNLLTAAIPLSLKYVKVETEVSIPW